MGKRSSGLEKVTTLTCSRRVNIEYFSLKSLQYTFSNVLIEIKTKNSYLIFLRDVVFMILTGRYLRNANWDKITKSRCKSPYRNFISFKGIIAHIEKLKLANIIIIIKNYSHLPPEAGSILV